MSLTGIIFFLLKLKISVFTILTLLILTLISDHRTECTLQLRNKLKKQVVYQVQLKDYVGLIPPELDVASSYLIKVSDPPDACKLPKDPPVIQREQLSVPGKSSMENDRNGDKWALLVVGDGCDFSIKVTNAHIAGYDVIIVKRNSPTALKIDVKFLPDIIVLWINPTSWGVIAERAYPKRFRLEMQTRNINNPNRFKNTTTLRPQTNSRIRDERKFKSDKKGFNNSQLIFWIAVITITTLYFAYLFLKSPAENPPVKRANHVQASPRNRRPDRIRIPRRIERLVQSLSTLQVQKQMQNEAFQLLVDLKRKPIFSEYTKFYPRPLPAGFCYNNRFYIKSLINMGGFGDVYHARDNNFFGNGNVAIKVECSRPDATFGLAEEARIYEQLTSTTESRSLIPKMISYSESETDNASFLVMELLGPSLEEILQAQSQAFEYNDSLLFMCKALTCLEFIHTRKIIHQDIKPSNFVFGEFGTRKAKNVYLVDFGISTSFWDDVKNCHVESKVTSRGAGTIMYASTNWHRCQTQSRKDDLESLGYVAMRLVKGRLPWDSVKLGDDGNNETAINQIEDAKTNIDPTKELRDFPALSTYMKCVNALGFEETPNYESLRNIFRDELPSLNSPYDERDFRWSKVKHLEKVVAVMRCNSVKFSVENRQKEVKKAQLNKERFDEFFRIILQQQRMHQLNLEERQKEMEENNNDAWDEEEDESVSDASDI